MRTKWTIGTKLNLAFGAMIAATVVLGVAALYGMRSLEAELHYSSKTIAKKTELIVQVAERVSTMRVAQRGVILYSMMKQPSRVTDATAQFGTSADEIHGLAAELMPMLERAQAREALNRIDQGAAGWKTEFATVSSLCTAGQFGPELAAVVDRTFAIADPMTRDAKYIRETQGELREAAMLRADEVTDRSHWLVLAISALSLAIAVVVSLMIRSLTRTLRRISHELSRGAEQVASASSHVAAASQSIAQGASEQAASVEQTSASTHEIASMAENSASVTRSVAEQMKTVSNVVTAANHKMTEMAASMQRIQSSSGKISKIIKTIDEIAFQTNILALNAAVEAARAGEMGMGFAVVAEEVRNLAQRSAHAAEETTQLIEEAVTNSREGAVKVDAVMAELKAVAEGTGHAHSAVDDISRSSDQQVTGVGQISQAIIQMEQVTQTMAATSEQAASASEELAAEAQTMHRSAADLMELVGQGARVRA